MAQTTQCPEGLPLPQALSLAGRTVVVTGAASGIGRATAHVLASLGASLVISDRAALADVKAELEKTGATVRTLEADMTDSAYIGRLIGMGPIHGLAHCAGILRNAALKGDPNLRERFHRVMDVNVLAPLEIGMALTDHMAENGGGSMVFIGSVAGRTGGTSLKTPVDYSASKGAVHVVVRWLSRNAVGRNVLVNGVAPGPIATPMTAGSTIDPASLPRGRMGRPEEIAWMVAMLLTPAASYVSGAVLDANGGSYVG
jgi:3-oxoacyl-[acyl-carrier protein] reductase